MNWFTKLFGPKPLSQSDRDFFDACNAFTTGGKIFQEAVLIKGEGWKESQLIKIKEALEYFDQAIKKGLVEPTIFSHGFDQSEVYSLRGSCLNDLGFYFEALEDYNKAIEKRPRKGVASNYHMRSVIKSSLFDFEGSLADLKEAIRLSKLDNDDNAYWNNYAKSTGFASQTAFYEMLLPTEAEIISKKRICSDKNFVEEELKKVKRRER
jgi:tetratricopeptide (TPR) repeat protein